MQRDERHYPSFKHGRELGHGELTVTGSGHVIIEQPLKRSRAMLVKSTEVVTVEFDPNDHHRPTCNPSLPDDLTWDVIEKLKGGPLFLKITWRVSTARKILWAVYEVD